MADYFENVPWAVTFAELTPTSSDQVGHILPVSTDNSSTEEVREALRALSSGKAAGVDDILPEFLKVLLGSDSAVGELV